MGPNLVLQLVEIANILYANVVPDISERQMEMTMGQ